MKITRKTARDILLILAVLIAAGCGPPLPERSYSRIQNPPGLAKDTAAITGIIRWKGSGAEGVTIILCEDLDTGTIIDRTFSCKKEYGKTTTDENGVYWFKDLPVKRANEDPSNRMLTYTPIAVVGDVNPVYFYWKRVRNGVFDYEDSIIPYKNETYEVKPLDIRRNDLKLTSPTDGQKIADRRPALVWEEYPEADHYYVFLWRHRPSYLSIDLDLKRPGAKPVVDLSDGHYSWKVSARSKTEEIAESSDMHFEVVSESQKKSGRSGQ